MNKSPLKSFQESLLSDSVSAFGGIVACNFKINKSLAIELAPEIRVNSVAPGAIIWADSEDTEERNEALSFTPLKRTGAPTDIGKAVLYLAESAYVTGQILRVDGGRALNV